MTTSTLSDVQAAAKLQVHEIVAHGAGLLVVHDEQVN
jgi:hypothetical protein